MVSPSARMWALSDGLHHTHGPPRPHRYGSRPACGGGGGGVSQSGSLGLELLVMRKVGGWGVGTRGSLLCDPWGGTGVRARGSLLCDLSGVSYKFYSCFWDAAGRAWGCKSAGKKALIINLYVHFYLVCSLNMWVNYAQRRPFPASWFLPSGVPPAAWLNGRGSASNTASSF